MPIGGKLVLKGGETLKVKGVEKKKKKKKTTAEDVQEDAVGQEGGPEGQAAAPGTEAKKIDPTAVNILTGKTYEQDFDLETQRADVGKTRSTPWGSSYRAPPEILHGYTTKVTGKNAQERLDLRCAKKADKFCK